MSRKTVMPAPSSATLGSAMCLAFVEGTFDSDLSLDQPAGSFPGDVYVVVMMDKHQFANRQRDFSSIVVKLQPSVLNFWIR